MHLTKYSKLIYTLSFVFILFLFVVPNKVLATDYYVAGDTGLDTNNGSITTPWKTIQKAAGTALQPGDVVNVKGGLTYAETVTPSTSGTLGGGYITYQAWSGTGIPVIDGAGKSAGFSIVAKDYIKINGFEIKNISQNFGAGINTTGKYLMATNNIIRNMNCTFCIGVFVHASIAGESYIYNNTISNITGPAAKGIHIESGLPSVNVYNNIVANCTTAMSDGTSGVGIFDHDYNFFYGNTANFANLTASANEHIQDPLFLDANNFDFRLAANSALINAGVVITEVEADIIGISRPQGSGYDVGAYEYDGVLGEQVNIEPFPQDQTRDSNLIEIFHIDGETAGDQFGLYVGGPNMAVTDANDDGYDDLIAGARYHYTAGVDLGGIYVFNGKQNPTDLSATNADTIIRESVYGAFGELNIVDDITGDGIPELISSHYRGLPGHVGKVYVFNKSILTSGTGSSADAIATIIGSYSEAKFAVYGTVLGDVNNDGIKDYVFSGANDTKAYLFYGESSISDKNATGASVIYTNDINGSAVSYVKSQFDINGDGYKDIGIICTSCIANGGLYIFKGGPNLLSKNLSQADIIMSGSSGKNISEQIVAGDFDGDGTDDLIVGSGGIFFFKGKDNFTSITTDSSDSNISSVDIDGSTSTIVSLGTADVNNDGCSDLIVSNGIPRIYVLYGCSLKQTGLSSPNLIYVPTSDMSRMVGNSFETGDTNGDGYNEIFVSDPIYANGNYKGRIYVLGIPHGKPTITTTSIGGVSSSGKITGTVTDSYTHGGVEFSFDGGGFTNCDLNGDNFSCNLPSSSAGSNHTVSLRYKNSLGVYIPEREYKVVNFKFLTTAGNNSSTSCTTTLNTNLTPSITNLKPLNNNTSVELTLQNNDTNATEYIIEYGTTKTNLNYSALNIPVSSKTYTINKLNPTKQYYFRVRTTNGCGFSNWSSLTSIKNEELTINNSPEKNTKIFKSVVAPFTKEKQKENINIFQIISNWLKNLFTKFKY